MVLLFLVAYARDRRSQCSCSLMFCVSLEIVQTARCQSSIFLCVLEASNTAIWGSLPWSLNSKKSTFQCRRCKRHGFDPWVRNTPWSRKWQPTPVLAGKSCGGGGKPGGLHSKVLQRVEHNWATNTFIQKNGGFWIIRLHNWLPKGNVTKVQRLKHVILLEVDIRNFRVISSTVSCFWPTMGPSYIQVNIE